MGAVTLNLWTEILLSRRHFLGYPLCICLLKVSDPRKPTRRSIYIGLFAHMLLQAIFTLAVAKPHLPFTHVVRARVVICRLESNRLSARLSTLNANSFARSSGCSISKYFCPDRLVNAVADAR